MEVIYEIFQRNCFMENRIISTEVINKGNKKSSFMKLFIVLIILFMTVASFFVCPDIWLIFNGGWF